MTLADFKNAKVAVKFHGFAAPTFVPPASAPAPSAIVPALSPLRSDFRCAGNDVIRKRLRIRAHFGGAGRRALERLN
jgi:hypothetical protein